MQRFLRFLNHPRRRVRWARKALFVALAVLLALYPRPDRLVRNLRHWSNLTALIEPHHPALDALAADAAAKLATHADAVHGPLSAREELAAVQALVYSRIPYAWDWDTWSVADYVPTLAEALAAGREDCDGRAVVAASLLVRFGYEARIVSDLSHVWVWTPRGQTMSPMSTASGRTVVSPSARGNRVDARAVFNHRAILIDWPTNLAYGIAVFPWWRTAAIAFAAWLAVLASPPRSRRIAASAALIAGALSLIAVTSSDPWQRRPWSAWVGFAGLASGAVVAATGSQRRTAQLSQTPNYRSC